MGMIQRFGVNKGINSRVNKLFVKDGFVEDAQNVIPNVEKDTIDGRPGKSLLAPNAGTNGLIETYSDLIKSKALYGMYSIGAKLYKWALDGLSWVDVGGGYTLGAADAFGVLDTLEYNSSLYIAKMSATSKTIGVYGGNGLNAAGISNLVDFKSSSDSFVSNAPLDTVAEDWDPATNIITKVGHALSSGLRVRVSSTFTLPAGIIAGEYYYINVLSATQFKLSYVPSVIIAAPTDTATHEVNFTDSGTPTKTHTLTFYTQLTGSIQGKYTFTYIKESGEEIISPDVSFGYDNITLDTGYQVIGPKFLEIAASAYKCAYAQIPEKTTTEANTATTSTSPTLTVKAGHTLSIGDWVYLRNNTDVLGIETTAYKITNVVGNVITFDNPQQDSIYFKGYISNWKIDIYIDYDATGTGTYTGVYRLSSTRILSGFVTNTGFGIISTEHFLTAVPSGRILTLDDSDNYAPPLAKYIEEFQGVMFLGNVKIENISRPQSICFSNVDSIEYHMEKFDASYNEIVVGEDKEGAITGLKKNNDGLIIFKERAIYTLTGDVRLNNFIIRKVYGSTVGCIAHGSIQEVGDMIGFLSATGVHAYRIGLDKPIDMSINIYPDILADVSPYATSAYDFIAKRYFLHTGTKMFVFDLFGEGWWKWTNTTADGGLCYSISKDRVMLVGKDTSDSWELVDTLLADDTSAGGTVAISKFIKSTWESLNKQEFQKKFKAVKIFCIPNTGVTLQVKLRTDWETTAITDQTVALDDSPYIVTEEVKPDSGYRQAKCMQVEFLHSSATEAFSISGWSLEYEPDYFESKKFSKAAP